MSRPKIRIAIAGATGYGGLELVRLLSRHPGVELALLTSETYAGQRLDQVYPHLLPAPYLLHRLDAGALAQACDCALLCLPATRSMGIVPLLLDQGLRVIDIGPDFRLKDKDLFSRYYKAEHASPHLLAESVCGVPELRRQEIARARLVSAGSCYTTSALLALRPFLRWPAADLTTIVVDSKSGLSGAGRTSLALEYHHPEANEDVSAYAVGDHRHRPEMEQELSSLAGRPVRIAFTPHLVPMTRGLFTTAYVRLSQPAESAALTRHFEQIYSGEPFVTILPPDRLPHTKWTSATNHAFLAVRHDPHSASAIVLSVLDNLGKGLAGQMVQCLNLMFGFEETTGLLLAPSYP
jgi:N-acetyl-gamma-glutamyl-phosphate reductase